MNKDKIVSIIVVLLVLGAVGYGLFGMDNSMFKNASATVAKVNGTGIAKETFDAQLALAIESFKQQGVDVTNADNIKLIRDQVLNDLVSNELVMQEIARLGVSATADEINAQFSAVEAQTGGKEALSAELAKANITEEKFRENIARQLTVQKYLAQNVNLSSVAVTDAEVEEFYNTNGGQTEGAPALADVREQIVQQLTLNKQQALISAFIATLREKATVEVTVQ